MQPTGERRETAGVVPPREVSAAEQSRDQLLAPFRDGQTLPAYAKTRYERASSELTAYLGVLAAREAGASWVTPAIMQEAGRRGLDSVEALLALADLGRVPADDLQELRRVMRGNQ